MATMLRALRSLRLFVLVAWASVALAPAGWT
jgi:hypothetical protein